jgi:hypothetical protein
LLASLCSGELPLSLPFVGLRVGLPSALCLFNGEAIEERLDRAVRVDAGKNDSGGALGRPAAALDGLSAAGYRCRVRAAGSNPFLLPDRQLRRRQSNDIPLGLRQLNRREHRPKTFVLHHLTGVDVRVLVEGRVGELPPVAIDLDATVLPLVDADLPSAEAQRLRRGRDTTLS